MISLTAICWAVGIYMLLVGIIVGVLEAPFFYQFFDLTKKWVEKFKGVQPIHRAVVYILSVIFLFLFPRIIIH